MYPSKLSNFSAHVPIRGLWLTFGRSAQQGLPPLPRVFAGRGRRRGALVVQNAALRQRIHERR